MYTYVENNPLIYSDPTGNWCTATVSGKYYSHPGKCSGSGSGQDYIPDENGTNFGRMVFDAGVAKGKWYPEGAFYIKGDKTGISDAAIGCAYDSQCLGFVGGAVSEIPSAYNGVKTGVSKGANWVKGLIGGDKRSTNVNIPNAENLKMSKTVQNHMNDIIKKGPNKGDLSRPYIDSNGTTLLTREIMNAGTPVRDASLKNGLRWDVVGTFRGSTGKWQLVIDLDSNTIVHFNFVAK
ncbi:hypothetical protein HMSSN036_46780 [Paenibacillus macerans]|nr:hypothetical protein HMSSN036_46780 [Paenibacillus macerans]